MSASSFESVERAFQAAMNAREKGETPDLVGLCNGDEAVAAEVRALLKHLDAAGPDDSAKHAANSTAHDNAFLHPGELHGDRLQLSGDDDDAAAQAYSEWGRSVIGQRVGEFTLLGELGSGGMGIVFLASQDNPRRTVALKLIRRAIATPTMVRRFEREAQLLGRLNHPGIAQVYAAGVAQMAIDPGGPRARTPFIAMELVEGPTILEHVRRNRAAHGPDVALRLVAQACDAIGHAHQRGVIHRDLKPANILIAAANTDQPVAKVLDFGVARRADDDTRLGGDAASAVGLATTQLTFHGHLIGTLAYMSPEQLSAGAEADVRSDVYALGAILFQLLADRYPIDVTNTTLLEAAKRITEEQPPWLGTIDPALRGDIETIVAKALEKNPARRYQSPAELARDLRHYLAGEPIEARRDSMMYVLRKQAARYRALAAATILVLVCAVALMFYAQYQQRQQEAVARMATLAQGEADVARHRADKTAENLAAELSASHIAEGKLLGSTGDLVGAERLLWDELFYRSDKNAARWALWELYARSGCALTVAAHRDECRAVALWPDDPTRFVTCGNDPIVRMWDLEEGTMLAEYDGGVGALRGVACVMGGKDVAAVGGGGAVLIDMTTGERRILSGDGSEIDAYGVDVSPDGSLIAVADNGGTIRLFDRTIGKQVKSIERGDSILRRRGARAVCFDTTGTKLAATYDSGDVKMWTLARSSDGAVQVTPGAPIAGHPVGGGASVKFNADGAVLASGGTDRNLKLWRVADGNAIVSTATMNGTVRGVTFAPDGKTLAAAGFWRTQFFNINAEPIAPPGGMMSLGASGAHASVYTPDGNYLITAQDDGSCRVWKLNGEPFVALPSTRATVRDLAVLHVGDEVHIVSAQIDGSVRVRAAPYASRLRTKWRDVLQSDAGDQIRCMSATLDGSHIVVGRADGHVVTIDGHDGQLLQNLEAHSGTVNLCRISPDGSTLITCGVDGFVRTWLMRPDRAGWVPSQSINCDGDVLGVAINPDGTLVATTNRPNTLRFWSLSAGRLNRIREYPTSSVPWKPAFDRKGLRLAVGAWDRSIMLWDTSAMTTSKAAAHHELSVVGHTQLPVAEAFGDSSRLLASAAMDGTLKLWNIEPPTSRVEPSAGANTVLADRRRCLASLDARAGDAMCVAFLPDGNAPSGVRNLEVGQSVVAVGYTDGTIRLWDLQYFHEAVIRNSAYQRSLRGMSTGTNPKPSSPPPATRPSITQKNL